MGKTVRNYRKEYDDYHGDPEQIKRRSNRNKARRKMQNKHGFLDRLSEVDHIDGDPNNNSMSNLRVTSRSKNRKKGRKGYREKSMIRRLEDEKTD